MKALNVFLLTSLCSGFALSMANDMTNSSSAGYKTTTATYTTASTESPTTIVSTSATVSEESTTDVVTTPYVTSSTEASTTTSKPTTPNSTHGIWIVKDGDTTCILVQFTGYLVVPYVNISDGKVLNSSHIVIPEEAEASGSCSTQELTLKWMLDSTHYNKLTFVFGKNESQSEVKHDQFFIEEVKLRLFSDPIHFSNGSEAYITGNLSDVNYYRTNLNYSYRCNSEDKLFIPLDTDMKNLTALVFLKHVQIQAYHVGPSGDFSAAMDCSADGMLTSDIVPIAVGCALAALVVIVLIAYLIGRRRARQRGYQSV